MGYMIMRVGESIPGCPDMETDFNELLAKSRPYSMVSVERMYALYKAVEYAVKNHIPGDFVECGVWRGGSSMMMALALQKFGSTDRTLYLYDTYEGMSQPTEFDVGRENNSARKEWEARQANPQEGWFAASVDTVKANLYSTGYPKDKLVFVKGKVEETIPGTVPEKIAILRLDTDWYESTLHELNHLFPRVSRQGVLILDDYGYWQGARKAVDQYIREHNISILLNRIDTDGRIGMKVI